MDEITALRHQYQELLERLQRNEREFRRLGRAVWRVQEDERRRLARDLHDGVGQNLTALNDYAEQTKTSLQEVVGGNWPELGLSLPQALEEPLEAGKEKPMEKARQHVTDRLIELAPVFTKTKHMLGDDFTMLDVAIAPLLWRLDHYGVKLGKTAAPLMKYAERIFSRPAFIEALTASEKVMRK